MLLDGKPVAQAWQQILQERVKELLGRGIQPGLAVILVGDDHASRIYTDRKQRKSHELGLFSTKIALPATTTTNELVRVIDELNHDTKIHGILVQLPLPEQMNALEVLSTIAPEKDVDGLHPVSLGKLMIGAPVVIPATPKAILYLLDFYSVPTEGKHVVIVGRSNILGKPLAAMFLNRNATVTICHSKTTNLGALTRQADIIVMDTGVPNLLDASMVCDTAVVVDAGISRLANGDIVGDVNFTEVAPRVQGITPVPGGVGPVTIMALIDTTIERAEHQRRFL